MIGDQQSALYGQGAVAAGDSKATYGTGAFLLMNTGDKMVPSKNRLLTTAALGPAGEPAYALEGSVFIAGAAVQWLRDGLKLVRKAADTYAEARASLAKNKDRTQPYVVPAFVGLGAPYWDANARGAIVGITRGTTRADIVRATLDSIAYQVRDVIVAMESDTGTSDERAARRRRRHRESLPDAVPGGYPWQAGPAREDSGDDCDGRGDARGPGHGNLEVAG